MKYDCLYVVGDSFALGADVKNKDCFATLLGNKLNLPVINKGLGGAGNYYVLRTIYNDIYKLKNEGKNPLVIVVYSQWMREEFFSEEHNNDAYKGFVTVTTNPWIDSKFFKLYYQNHFNENYVFEKTLIYINAVQNILKIENIDRLECFSMDHPLMWENTANLYKQANIDTTRILDIDLTHYSPYDKFYIPGQDMDQPPVGHLTEVGNAKVANWMYSKIVEWYL